VDVWSWVVVSVFLLVAAAGLMFSHVRAWRLVQQREANLDAEEFAYRRGQFRRRMQTSAMLGTLAVALLAGRWVTVPRVSATVFLVYWGIVLLLLVWLGLLAVADIVSTKYHYGRVRDEYVIEEAKLRAELQRIERIRGNGKSRPDDAGRGLTNETGEKSEE
jgi:hypothetical protein